MKIWIKPEYEVVPRTELLRRGNARMYHACYRLSDTRRKSLARHAQTEKFKRTQAKYISSDKGQTTRSRTASDWYNDNPEAKRAHNILNKSVLRGKTIRQSCEVCGAKDTHAHHPDYMRPLEVQWLCPTHHKQKHPKGG